MRKHQDCFAGDVGLTLIATALGSLTCRGGNDGYSDNRNVAQGQDCS